jgi:hypothetical protein
MQHESLEDGPAGDLEHRLGHGLGERSEARALAAGHDHRPVRADDPPEDVVQQVEADRPAGRVHHGYGVHPASAHQLDGLDPTLAGTQCREPARHEGVERVLEDRTGEQGPAQVAIGHDPDEPPVDVHRERDLRRSTIQRSHRVADGARHRDEAGLEFAMHRRAQQAGPGRQ